jgi:DNA polymerase III epsilon subunit-like protein
MFLLFKVETNGLISRNTKPFNELYKSLHLFNNARIVQIHLLLCNEDDYSIIEEEKIIIKIDDFTITNTKYHGITDEISVLRGIPFIDAVSTIMHYVNKSSVIYAFNIQFDYSVLLSEMYRYNRTAEIATINDKPKVSIMEYTTELLQIKLDTNKCKFPSLSELFEFTFEDEFKYTRKNKYDTYDLIQIMKKLEIKL